MQDNHALSKHQTDLIHVSNLARELKQKIENAALAEDLNTYSRSQLSQLGFTQGSHTLSEALQALSEEAAYRANTGVDYPTQEHWD